MRTRRFSRAIIWAVCLSLFGSLILPSVSQAKTAHEIDTSVRAALDRFMTQGRGSRQFLRDAKGVLVLADVYQAGFGVGGEYGEGATRIGGQSLSDYNITPASIAVPVGCGRKGI